MADGEERERLRPTPDAVLTAHPESPTATSTLAGSAEIGWRRLLITLAISELLLVVVVGGLVAVPIMVYLMLQGYDPEVYAARPMVLVPVVTAIGVARVGLVWYVACRRPRRSLSEGLAVRPVSMVVLLMSIALGIAGAWGIPNITYSLEGMVDSPMVELMQSASADPSVPKTSLLMICLALIAPPLEELYYRGFIYTALRRLTSVFTAFAVAWLFFEFKHAHQLSGDWYLFAGVAIMGLIFGVLRERYNSILPSLACHWTYNLVLLSPAILEWIRFELQ